MTENYIKYMCNLKKNIQKTLKMTKITVGLTLRLIFVPNQVMKFVLMGPIALREPKMCH